MKIIEISALDNGSHRNQSYPRFVPPGWAILPDDVEATSFPFGKVTVEEKNGIMTVTKWESIEILPQSSAPETALQYTETQLLGQQLTDEELARIELGQQITDLELMVLGGM